MAAISPPTDFQITAQTTTSITLSWKNNDAYSSLQIAYGLYSLGDFPYVAIDTSPESTSATITDLAPNTQYQFQLLVTKDIDLPKVFSPTLTVDKVNDSQIFFTITADPRATSSHTEISLTRAFDFPRTVVGNGALSASSLNPYTEYYLRARSIGDNIDYESSDWLLPIKVRTTLTLASPSIIDQVPTATSISFNITSVLFAASYLIEVSLSPEFDTLLYTSSQNGEHTIDGLAEDTTVYIRAQAISSDHHSDSDWAVAMMVTLPPPGQLPVPIPVSTTDNGDSTLTLRWSYFEAVATPDQLSVMDRNDGTLLFNWTFDS